MFKQPNARHHSKRGQSTSSIPPGTKGNGNGGGGGLTVTGAEPNEKENPPCCPTKEGEIKGGGVELDVPRAAVLIVPADAFPLGEEAGALAFLVRFWFSFRTVCFLFCNLQKDATASRASQT